MAAGNGTASIDARYVKVAKLRGCRPGLARVIIAWCRHYGLPISLGFALIQHESGFRKVFGHDPTIYSGAGKVTKLRFLRYRKARRASGNRLMQGAGEAQLTWWETQDLADAYGGCWKADANIHAALQTLAANIKTHGYVQGIARYNGGGAAAQLYSHQVRAAADDWHEALVAA